ncbi:AraC family transcriptional regulator, partial [Pseudomonas lactis]|nr:AraC family transcriptional regulator [Pseudomonas lactis]
MTSTPTPLNALIQSIGSRTPSPGDYAMPIPGLGFYRREQPAAPVVCMVEPC